MKSGTALFVIISLAAIAAAATLVYASTWSDAFLSDDWIYLLHSKNLTFSTFLHNCSFVPEDKYYRPVAIGYFYLNYSAWGLEPAGYHVVKGLLFAATAALLFVFVLRATGLRVAALAAGLVFALQPLNSSCAIWISTHANVLCAFFYLLALVLFVEVRKRERFSFPLYAGFLASMLLCFGSYELGYTLPAALILADLLLKPQGSRLKPHTFLRAHAPYLVAAGAFLAVRFAYLGMTNFAEDSTGEAPKILPAVTTVFMPVGVMDASMPHWARLLPALAGLVFFAAVLVFGRGLRRTAIFAALLWVVGAVPAYQVLNSVPAFEHVRLLIISTMGFGILIGSYVSFLWQWRIARVTGGVFLAALLVAYAWLDFGQKEKWSAAASQSETIIETAAEACRGESPPFRLVFVTYPPVHGFFYTEPHFLMQALPLLNEIPVDEELLPRSPYIKILQHIRRQRPEARERFKRWLPVRLDNLDLYKTGIFTPADNVYRVSGDDLPRTFFFYWDNEGRRLVNCTEPMRERLSKKRDKNLFDWSGPEKIPAAQMSFTACRWLRPAADAAMYLYPLGEEDVSPVIVIAPADTTCMDFDFVEIDLTATSNSWREGYFNGYVTFLLKGEDKPLPELRGRGAEFEGAYYEGHENHHIYRIPLAQKFLAYDEKPLAMLYIVLSAEVEEYALRGVRLGRFDE